MIKYSSYRLFATVALKYACLIYVELWDVLFRFIFSADDQVQNMPKTESWNLATGGVFMPLLTLLSPRAYNFLLSATFLRI